MSARFDFSSLARMPLLDGHMHVWRGADRTTISETLELTGARRFNVLSIPFFPAHAGSATLNDQALDLKAHSHGRAYAFGALDYSAGPRLSPANLAAQAEYLTKQGFDGIKMWEGKPSIYVHLFDRLEGPLYAQFFAWAEAHGLPLLMHVGDPARFWDPSRATLDPWSYARPGYPAREELYAELERLLALHPRLKVIFAHFFFLWDDLPRAAHFLDAHPSVCLDLAPAVEGYLFLSEQTEPAHEFFVRYADRIVYGTDIGAGPVVDSSSAFDSNKEAGQSWLVRTFLETECDVPIPPGVGAVTNQFAGRHLRGIALSADVLKRIYWGNFERIVSAAPHPL